MGPSLPSCLLTDCGSCLRAGVTHDGSHSEVPDTDTHVLHQENITGLQIPVVKIDFKLFHIHIIIDILQQFALWSNQEAGIRGEVSTLPTLPRKDKKKKIHAYTI